jgi:hypothetical protein
MLVGRLRDRTGSYDTGFVTLICAAVLGAVAIALLPRHRLANVTSNESSRT